MKTFLIVALLFIGLNAQNPTRYDGYQLIRVFPTSPEHVKLIEEFESNDNKFDVWNSIRKPIESFDVLISPDSLLKYKTIFKLNNISFQLIDNNIQNKLDEQQVSMLRSKSDLSIINRYARYTEIMSFIDQTVQNNSDIASSYIAGKSYENRLLKVIVLKPVSTSTRSLWIDCGIHAREWVSPATCVYIINRLINEFRANDPKTVEIFQKYEIHIMPLVNPDGYEYTFNTVRLWRKNKTPSFLTSCIGVDLNRNFGYKWYTAGSSNQPCVETYAGPSADSESEVQAIENALKNKTGNWDAYISVHSYGNMWLLPYGFAYPLIDPPPFYEKMKAKGQIGCNAIKAVYGQKYEIGASSEILYLNSGGSKDWTTGYLKIKYSYGLELRPGINDPDYRYGFALPEDRMPLIGDETYAGIKAFYLSIVTDY